MMKISAITAQPRIPRLTMDWVLGDAGLQIETSWLDLLAASNVDMPIASTMVNPSGLVFAASALIDSISLASVVATGRRGPAHRRHQRRILRRRQRRPTWHLCLIARSANKDRRRGHGHPRRHGQFYQLRRREPQRHRR